MVLLTRFSLSISALFLLVCPAQAQQAGLTLQTSEPHGGELNVFVAACASEAGATCNPFLGDTLCSATRPALCIIDLNAPVPATLEDDMNWTGGLLALGPKMRGDSVATITQADAVCEATFGEGWRLARFRDGGGDKLVGFGGMPATPQSVWVDIKDQPRATCWVR